MPDRIGQQFGNYRLLRLLGFGGFAEVYLGEHIYLKNLAAIKVLYARLSKDDLESFLVEGRTLVNLIHPHIVRVLEFGVEGEMPYLVIDYAPNGSLRQYYDKFSILPLPLIVDYVRQVADALQFAHNQKVIHRDVKPANMLLGRQNELLLSDFGTAILAQSSRYQGSQDMAGTVAYMAPEQIQAHPRPASDQYSLGIVVYEWLSGDRPFHGTFTEVIAKHAFAPPPPLRERNPSILPAVEQVVLIALEKNPSKRFASVSAFALALEQASQSAHLYPSSIPSPSSNESMLSTLITPLAQPLQSPEIYTPPVSRQPGVVPPSLGGADLSSLAPTRVTTTSSSPGQTNSRRNKYPLLAGLLLLLLAGLVVAGFVFFPFLHNPLGSSAVTPTPIPTSGASPSPANTTPIVFTNITGSYSGTVHNTLRDIYAPITLSINQNSGAITGQLTIDPQSQLKGTGSFTGNIDRSNNVQFLVISSDTTNPILFRGIALPDGSLSGSYCSVQLTDNTQCDTTMGRGTWNAIKQ